MQQHVQHRSRADRVAGTVAEIQLRRLQARTRTEEGGAAKERVRTQPGLPWRLRAKGAKRARPAEVAVRADAAAVQPPAASDLLQMQPGKWPPLASVWSAVQNAGPPAEGLHHLVVPGPWPAPGSGKAVNGRLAGKWVCTGCGRRAGDSSRAVALARTPCGAAVWEARAAFHTSCWSSTVSSFAGVAGCKPRPSMRAKPAVRGARSPVSIAGSSLGWKARPGCGRSWGKSAATAGGARHPSELQVQRKLELPSRGLLKCYPCLQCMWRRSPLLRGRGRQEEQSQQTHGLSVER